MLADLLRRFEPFAALEWGTLCSVARHARLLRLAARRTLAPTGRMQNGSCYLVKGSVRRRMADGRIESIADGDAAARRALLAAGDGAAVETLVQVTLLWVDLDPIAFLLGAAPESGYAVERIDAAADAHWMHRFLGPGLCECLEPSVLQAVFRAFTPLAFDAGATVVEEGEPGESFYVLASGTAEVRRAGRTLVALAPGDSFGADALVCAEPRNASVRMLSNGTVMRLAQQTFADLVQQRLVRWVDRGFAGVHTVDLTVRPGGPDALRRLVGELDLGTAYLFDGGAERDRALAAYLAAQRGVRAFARRSLR
jgi:signal-transduction protein with cAMP-binding, CBS, and nucleotidyltransferase domain